GSSPSTRRARNQSSAASVRASASSKAAAVTPSSPMHSARAPSIVWMRPIASSLAPACNPDRAWAKTPRSALPRRPRLRLGAGAGGAGDAAVGGAQSLRAADDGHQHAVIEQALGRPLGVVERHRVDQGGAALDVVDAEIVDLLLDELGGDPVRGIQA